MDRVPFHILTDAEFQQLPKADKLLYLASAIQAHRAWAEQSGLKQAPAAAPRISQADGSASR